MDDEEGQRQQDRGRGDYKVTFFNRWRKEGRREKCNSVTRSNGICYLGRGREEKWVTGFGLTAKGILGDKMNMTVRLG